MDNDEPNLPLVALDEHDTAAVSALLIKVVRTDDELKRDRELLAEANARIAANAALRAKTVAAFAVFGFELGDDIWPRVREAVGSLVYDRAIAIARGTEVPLLQHLSGSEQAKQQAGYDQVDDRTLRQAPRIKDAVLEYLLSAGEAGAGVKEVRRHLADAYGISVHEKTPGMTLYRLLKDGLVTRKGRTWYAAKGTENEENEAPNGGAAGASETARAAL